MLKPKISWITLITLVRIAMPCGNGSGKLPILTLNKLTMKQLFFILFFTFLVSHGYAQSNYVETNKLILPMITKDFEKFDFDYYHQLSDNGGLSASQVLPNGTYVEMIIFNSNLTHRETPKDSYFTLSKQFYRNGNIQFKGLQFNSFRTESRKGIWYEFDEQGKLIKTTDYDQFFKFTFEDILAFCDKNKIITTKGPILTLTGFHTQIDRLYVNKKSLWKIEWLKKADLIEIITLDGNTGKILKKEEIKYTNN